MATFTPKKIISSIGSLATNVVKIDNNSGYSAINMVTDSVKGVFDRNTIMSLVKEKTGFDIKAVFNTNNLFKVLGLDTPTELTSLKGFDISGFNLDSLSMDNISLSNMDILGMNVGDLTSNLNGLQNNINYAAIGDLDFDHILGNNKPDDVATIVNNDNTELFGKAISGISSDLKSAGLDKIDLYNLTL